MANYLFGRFEALVPQAMPMLLRQYLKLNARMLGLDVDPEFGYVLDALMVVDLTRVELPILARYMGRAEAEAFLRQHGGWETGSR